MVVPKDQTSYDEQAEGLRVLLVDDNPHDLVAIKRALRAVKDKVYEINSFTCLQEAGEHLEHHQDIIDICLVDYAMGDQTAFDFLELFEARRLRLLPVVVMTGQSQPHLDMQLMQAGVHDYCDKNQLNNEILDRCLQFAHHRHQKYQKKYRDSLNKNRHLVHVNHELRTPLNGIAGLTRMLERLWDKRDPESLARVRRCFEGIHTSTHLLMRLIDELLDLSEIESGQFTLNRTACDISTLVAEAIDVFRPMAEENKLSLHYEPPQGSVVLEVDVDRIRQIISNLISNAIKYTESGGVTVRLLLVDASSHRYINDASARQKWCRFQVEDTGIGIPPEQHTAVFAEYIKVHKLLNKQVNSTGLGLSITKKLVELHGGTIALDSTLGQGSCFTVDLPYGNHIKN